MGAAERREGGGWWEGRSTLEGNRWSFHHIFSNGKTVE